LLTAYLVLAACIAALIPVGVLLCQALPGWPSFFAHPRLLAEMTHSALLAGAAATTALLFAAVVLGRRALAIICCLPGLLGALALALALLAFFQQPLLRSLRDSPIPLLVALILLILPMAILLEFFLGAIRRSAELHLARQCGARGVVWQLEGRCTYAAFVLLFCAAYFEFTAGALLAPAGSTPIFVRLHNLAHYGSTAVLAAMMCAALAPPLFLCVAAPLVRRAHGRRG
jgi:ABC-type spermidine/putrescine transport system permease subunit II